MACKCQKPCKKDICCSVCQDVNECENRCKTCAPTQEFSVEEPNLEEEE